MGQPKFVVSNQKEEFISIQRVGDDVFFRNLYFFSSFFREGNNEVLVTINSNTSAYFSIVHNASDTDPLIVLAKNTTTYMTIDNTGKLLLK